jgi:hypothetical protein
VLIPGETFLAEGLAAAGLRVVQSPLLFQGGNLMVVRDPARGERVLLAGEAEVYRNVALGLTEAQATEALRVEMGADRCVVLPAAAFHIDYEVAVRAVGGRLLAFVNDTPAAVAIILSCGIDAMARGGVMAAAEATGAREALASRQLGRAVDIIGSAVMRGAVGPGRFGESFAKLFEAGPGDSGVGNLQRLLLALDLTAAALATPGNMPWDPHARAYLESFRRRDADRRVLWRRLETMGCRIIPVPSLAETPRGVNAVNLIQDSRRVLMPAYGGLYEALDRAAAGVIGAAVGAGTEVVPVRCGESQRRLGALHCASSVYAKP